MVFGWGKKKQDDVSVEEVPQTKEIVLSNIPKILSDLGELRKSKTLTEIKNLRNSTEPLINELMKIGNVLEKDNLNVDDIDKHLAIIVVRGKKQVIDVIKKDVTSLPKVSSLDDAEKLNLALNQILKKVGDVLGRQTRVIHIFAKKYATQLKDNLEVMNNNHSEIYKLLKNYNSTKSLSDEISETLNQINALIDSRKEKSHKSIDADENSHSIQVEIASIQNSIDKVRSSESYKRYLDLKNSLDEFGQQKQKIINEINDQFTKISRPLSRYEHASSLDKDQKNLLSLLIANPFSVLVPSNKDSIIIILENVRKGIASGSISVKDIDKTFSNITETVEALDGFVSQVSEYFEKYNKMKNDLNSLKPSDLMSLENDLDKNTSLLEESQTKFKTFQNEIDEIDSKIPRLISDIEYKLQQFSSTKYTVLMSQN
ncbi:exonuclease SbcC [Nitrosopumilus sp.]|uniref:exonuclease SbcC n=1 Tax=Nitrosopumilus sp. TaxID=2024843 RepID=UPI0034A078A8